MLYFQTWKTILVITICLLGIVFAAPNVMPQEMRDQLPSFFSKTLNLGLDLSGGVHLLWEVETDVLVSNRLETIEEDARLVLLANDLGYANLRVADGQFTVQIRNLAELSQAQELIEEMATPVDGGLLGGAPSQEFAVSASEGGLITVVLTEQAQDQLVSQAVTQSIEIVRRRIDELGTREPTIQRQGRNRIIMQVPGESDPQRIKDLVGTTAQMEFRMHDSSVPISEAQAGRVPPGSEVLPSSNPQEPNILVRRRALIDGDRLTNAQTGFDQNSGEPVVNIRFDNRGAQTFARITRENVGSRFAIVLDELVITAPRINESIPGGNAQISGNFTPETANDLAILLRAGALPAPLTVVEERTVGPGLGQDSIDSGKIAAMIGFALVIVFMIASYGLFGIYANIALIINVILIGGALSFLQATLTLPGIAGIILTIGMAVDANVLIFERIREEVAAGKTPINATETGYSRALGTILDANITTLIAAVILFMMGAGPVKGFAVTLGIGIITSVFTAVTVTRLMVATWLRTKRPNKLPI